ncbi:hypothetical protein CROQUDRAFT_673569 [Cronartium quercuum f. sp. fusiforme G11]|uniref:Uncharacterized protein n=1 Tax=Cronartium quercuum f. sp. fusiforme G11 TaxID=708437 RepID=A0A9P6NA51_9BASI|nr:hypothetical protein CROQUDRAFT_673569 [Cronartium quercuum f. sp. fusiforme G11]
MLFGVLLAVLALTASVSKGATSHEAVLRERSGTTSQITSGSLVTAFQTCQDIIDKQVPIFSGACESGNLKLILAGLSDVRHSIARLGSKCAVGHSADVTLAPAVSTHFTTLLLKLQVLLKILKDHNRVSQSQSSLASLQLPLNMLVSFFKTGGVDIGSKIKSLGSALDLRLFSQIGITLNIEI